MQLRDHLRLPSLNVVLKMFGLFVFALPFQAANVW
jgi:hypothetical protein